MPMLQRSGPSSSGLLSPYRTAPSPIPSAQMAVRPGTQCSRGRQTRTTIVRTERAPYERGNRAREAALPLTAAFALAIDLPGVASLCTGNQPIEHRPPPTKTDHHPPRTEHRAPSRRRQPPVTSHHYREKASACGSSTVLPNVYPDGGP